MKCIQELDGIGECDDLAANLRSNPKNPPPQGFVLGNQKVRRVRIERRSHREVHAIVFRSDGESFSEPFRNWDRLKHLVFLKYLKSVRASPRIMITKHIVPGRCMNSYPVSVAVDKPDEARSEVIRFAWCDRDVRLKRHHDVRVDKERESLSLRHLTC